MWSSRCSRSTGLLKISVTPERLLYSEGVTFWPSQMTLQNFVTVLEATDFPRYFLNSVIVSVSTAALVTVIATLAGYAMSRFAFRGKAGAGADAASDPDVSAGDGDPADLPRDARRSA